MSHWTPDQWTLFLGSLGLLFTGASAAVVKIILALRDVGQKVDTLEVKVDGRLTQLLEQTASASRAEGVVAGRVEAILPVPVPVVIVSEPSTKVEKSPGA